MADTTKRDVPKFKDEHCAHCGATRSVINPAWLRRKRETAMLTLAEMARRAGRSSAYLCDIEQGQRRCTLQIRAVYEALEVQAEQAHQQKGQ